MLHESKTKNKIILKYQLYFIIFRVYRKAIASPTIDDPYTIASAWLRFERCNGSLDQVASCQQQIKNFLKVYEFNQKSVTLKDKIKSKASKRKIEDDGDGDKIELKNEQDPNPFKKPFPKADSSSRAAYSEGESKAKNVKREKNVNFDPSSNDHEHLEIDTSKDNLRIFLSNLDYKYVMNREI